MIAHPLVSMLGSAVIRYDFLYRTDPTAAPLALLVALTVAMLAALLPVRRACQTVIRDILRGE
jgi:ABC-type lipoprotein release transport system permease subunit